MAPKWFPAETSVSNHRPITACRAHSLHTLPARAVEWTARAFVCGKGERQKGEGESARVGHAARKTAVGPLPSFSPPAAAAAPGHAAHFFTGVRPDRRTGPGEEGRPPRVGVALVDALRAGVDCEGGRERKKKRGLRGERESWMSRAAGGMPPLALAPLSLPALVPLHPCRPRTLAAVLCVGERGGRRLV